MIYAQIHNKRFKLYCYSRKIRNSQLTDDEKKYIIACVDDILLNCGKKERYKTEYIAQNLPDYGIKVLKYSDNKRLTDFLSEFFCGETNVIRPNFRK